MSSIFEDIQKQLTLLTDKEFIDLYTEYSNCFNDDLYFTIKVLIKSENDRRIREKENATKGELLKDLQKKLKDLIDKY